MLCKTRGLVLRSVKYSDSSLICHIYTEQLGLQTYILKGVRSARQGRTKAGILQPPSLLNMVVYHRENKQMQRIKEFHLDHTFTSIPFDIRKSSVALFIIEVLRKCIKTEEPDPLFFTFLYDLIIRLDKNTTCQNIPVVFLIQSTRYLGLWPHGRYSDETPFFDLKEGRFVNEMPLSRDCLNRHTSRLFYMLLKESEFYNTDKILRRTLLLKLLDYYQYHIPGFRNIQSPKIFETIFS